MSELVLLPDVERVVALALLDLLAGASELGPDRVYTVTPREVGADPFVLVRRVGGPPAVGRPLVLDAAELQLDCYGGSKRQAQAVARRVQAVLAELVGSVDDGMYVGTVTGTELGPCRWVPDESFEPARARYVLDATVWVKLGRQSPAGGKNVAAVTAAAGYS